MSRDQKKINTSAMLASVVGQVGCLVVFIVFVALGAGILLDKFLGTKALFTVLLMVGSVPVALYLVVRLSLTAVARAQNRLKEEADNSEENTSA